MAWIFISPYVNSTVSFGIRWVFALVEDPQGFPRRHIYLLLHEVLAAPPSFQYWVKSSLVIPLSGVNLLWQECQYEPAEDHYHHHCSPTPKSRSASTHQSEMLFLEEGLYQSNWAGKQRPFQTLMKVKNGTDLLLCLWLEIREIVLTWDEISWAESTIIIYTQVFVHMHVLVCTLLLGSKITVFPTNAFDSLRQHLIVT